jgi:hypothetical protein
MGTPQVRCRLMHQSGRDSTAPRMRLRPQSGIQRTPSTAASAAWRKAAPPAGAWSTATNHWSTARKTTGVLLRQQCG